MLMGGGLIAVFGSEHVGLEGAGPLGVVAAAFVSAWLWSTLGWDIEHVSYILNVFILYTFEKKFNLIFPYQINLKGV